MAFCGVALCALLADAAQNEYVDVETTTAGMTVELASNGCDFYVLAPVGTTGPATVTITERNDWRLVEPGPSMATVVIWPSSPVARYKVVSAKPEPESCSGDEGQGVIHLDIQPKISVFDVALLSPAKNRSWPYDPIWHDPDWVASVSGIKAVLCSDDVDKASVRYSLNKQASRVCIDVHEDVFGPVNPLVQVTIGTTSEGINEIDCWDIYLDDVDEYFATVTAQGIPDCIEDQDVVDSPNVEIKRKDYFVSDATSPMTSSSLDTVWQCTQEIYEQLVLLGYGTVFIVGEYYLGPYVGTRDIVKSLAWGLSLVELQKKLPGATTPKWMAPGNWVYRFGPWQITQYAWDSDLLRYKIEINPSTDDFARWNVSAVEIYTHDVQACPPPAGIKYLIRRFCNEYTGQEFEAEEMLKTPWQAGVLDHNAMGLKSPELVPAAP